ncbi:unnamed protein product [Rotaria sp. Silwood1]|nr:unnamed protein product [Rotaria sp. Silwood1]CAF5002919.1 unnamed protein product [Rotaria sp. Silwood1]
MATTLPPNNRRQDPLSIEREKQSMGDKTILTVYRGTQIPKEELQKLKENIGEEVLFNVNSLFKIHSINFDSTLGLRKVEFNTTEEYLKLAESQIQDYIPIIYFGRLLMYELGQVDRAENYFNMLLKSLPSDHPHIASVYN